MQEHGGAPKKYVSGAWVEAKMAVRTAIEEIADIELLHINEDEVNKEREFCVGWMEGKACLTKNWKGFFMRQWTNMPAEQRHITS
ncbi:MAG: hypothetical protein R2568_09415 [Candidatus Scalindua sp.]|nr:hypothetical protein [Candidatus Scalindua sp.]MDV5166948.1 hypothetical protein [Candidatus Scalindua sp.]